MQQLLAGGDGVAAVLLSVSLRRKQRLLLRNRTACLIETRCALLDELTHRDPEGFTRWLDSGARAASDPARFLTSTLRDRQLPHQHRDPER